MCGISGYYGTKKISREIIDATLKNMKQRGPDNQDIKEYKFKYNLYLLHSRLSIIDLDNRSSQPMSGKRFTISFNGEIYNYVELRNILKKKYIKFQTTSDTEVLLKGIEKFGIEFIKKLEGMWAISILDHKTGCLYLSRDQFGEKPLYYHFSNKNFFFGSQINYIKNLSQKKFRFNKKKTNAFLNFGYKAIFKNHETFFNQIYHVKPGFILKINKNLSTQESSILNLNYKTNTKSEREIIKTVKNKLINSLKIRTRSDVPLGFCLSGGIDSAALVAISKKKLNLNFKTYSIIDKNKKYNEEKEINFLTKHLRIHNKKIYFKKNDFINNLRKLIIFRQSPVSTISYYVHSQISKIARKDGVKVLFSGSGADELFTGYYDHYLIDILQEKNKKIKKDKIRYWSKYIQPNVRNPIFKNLNIFSKEFKNKSYIFDNKKNLDYFMENKSNQIFKEKKFINNPLKNRMLNELFYEGVPVILNEDDQNSMMNSIENRSPYLDKDLLNYTISIRENLFIQKGFNKYLLRSSLKNILPDKIRLNRKKIGFNFNLNSLVDFKDKKTLNWLLNKKSEIFKFINFKKFKKLILDEKKEDNYIQKFIFSTISTKIFLDECK